MLEELPLRLVSLDHCDSSALVHAPEFCVPDGLAEASYPFPLEPYGFTRFHVLYGAGAEGTRNELKLLLASGSMRGR